MEEQIMNMPAVALRGLTILPGMIAHFDISRERSLRAVEEAMEQDQKIYLVTQRNVDSEDPTQEDLYQMGIVADIKQVVRLQNDVVRILVDGISRAALLGFTGNEKYLEAEICYCDSNADSLPEDLREAMLLGVREAFHRYAAVIGKISKELIRQIDQYEDLEKLIDYVTNNLPVSYELKQQVLEAEDINDRYQVIVSLLLSQVEVISIKNELQKKVKVRVDKHQKEYVLREQLGVIREELGENADSEADEYEKKLSELDAPDYVKEKTKKEIKRFRNMSSSSSESTVERGYIETVLELPWNKMSVDNKDLDHAAQVLDDDHYGLKDVKERILEFLAVRNLTSKGESPIICLVGPPGTGKTTLAKVIANTTSAEFTQINATTAGKKDMEEVINKAKEMQGMYRKKTILFVDEIHRFNKGQQDYLLPFVEDGTIILIGATTENPYFEVNGALLSRSSIFELQPLAKEDIKTLITRAVYDTVKGMGSYQAVIDEDALEFLADISGGDARSALNAVELGILTTERSADGKIRITLDVASECIQKRVVKYDKTGDNHYDTISAFIKSMRGSDPDAAVYYLAKMLYAGEDIKFIARRIMICASEDVGNADPMALTVAVSASQAVERIGMPEAQIILSQAVTYVATAPKSNAACNAIFDAMASVKRTKTTVPSHLQDAHYKGAQKLGHGIGYKYAHDYPNHYVEQQYLPDEIKNARFYEPGDLGYEKQIKEHLQKLRKQ